MEFQCLEDRILIDPIKKTEESKTESGIITEMKKKETAEGVVVNVGQGRYAPETGEFMPTVLGKGDLVLYGINQGMSIEVPNGDGKLHEFKLMREGDVLMLIKKSDN